MANANSPFGFRPVTVLSGRPFSISEYAKPASDSTSAIFRNDLVVKVAGAVALPEDQGLGYQLPTIESGYRGSVGTSLWLGASLTYGALSTASVHPVADDPLTIFIAQCEGTNPMTTTSYIGKNANVYLGTAGSTVTKLSGMTVDTGVTTAPTTTNTLDLRLYRIWQGTPNIEGQYAIVEVIINKHQFGQQTAGV